MLQLLRKLDLVACKVDALQSLTFEDKGSDFFKSVDVVVAEVEVLEVVETTKVIQFHGGIDVETHIDQV